MHSGDISTCFRNSVDFFSPPFLLFSLPIVCKGPLGEPRLVRSSFSINVKIIISQTPDWILNLKLISIPVFQAGEVWQSNCHLCTCNNQTRTEECFLKPVPSCGPNAVLSSTSCCGNQTCGKQ